MDQSRPRREGRQNLLFEQIWPKAAWKWKKLHRQLWALVTFPINIDPMAPLVDPKGIHSEKSWLCHWTQIEQTPVADWEFRRRASTSEFRQKPIICSGGSRIFLRWGRQLTKWDYFSGASRISPGGRQHTILPKFPENCMKSKEFGCPGGRAPPAPPKSATVSHYHDYGSCPNGWFSGPRSPPEISSFVTSLHNLA